MNRRVWGVALLVIGVMALLQGIGLFDFGLAFWPILLVLAGGALVWGSFQHGFCSWLTLGLGLWVGSIGLFEILSNAGVTVIAAGEIVRHGWPLLLVAAGASILFGGRARACGWRYDSSHRDHAAHGHRYHIGDLYHGRGSWKLDGDLELNHGIGDVVLDLTTADISEGTHHVKVKAGIAELLVRVPDNVKAVVDASVSIGELTLFGEKRSGIGGLSLRREVPGADTGAELRIEARLGIGELTVVQAPASIGGAR